MVFYKYMDKWATSILEDLRLKVSPPNTFNDPFEFTPSTRSTITAEEILQEAHKNPEHFRPVYNDMVKHEAYPHGFEKFIGDLPRVIPAQLPEITERYRKAVEQNDLTSLGEASKRFGVLCVSKPKDSIAMWAHYADHHKGVVFGFDLNSSCFKSPTNEFGPVIYSTERCPLEPDPPVADLEFYQRMKRIMFTKSAIWEYEEEHRAIYRLPDLVTFRAEGATQAIYFLDIDGKAIREIIFGCRVDPGIESKIRKEVLRRRRTFGHIKFYRCQLHGSQFKLNIVPE